MNEQERIPTRFTFKSAPEEIGDTDETRQVPDTQEPTTKAFEMADSSAEDDLSVEELQRQQAEIDRKIRDKQEATKKAVIDQIVAVVNQYNIPVDELVDALGGLKIKRKGVKATQKFQDPVTGATWSGRGKEPLWIRGKDRSKFRIN